MPVPGDLIVENQSRSSPDGHVSIVDAISGSQVNAVEQNASTTGRHVYHINGTTLSGAYSSVRAIGHSPNNQSSSTRNRPLGDVNGDGKADLIWHYGGPNSETQVLFSDGSNFNGGISRKPMGTPYWGAVCDVNGDGKADAVWSNNGASVQVHLSDGSTFNGGMTEKPTGIPDWAGCAGGMFPGTNGSGFPVTPTPVASWHRTEENASQVTKTGLWSVSSASSASGGRYIRTRSRGAKITFAFQGRGIRWIAQRTRNAGIAAIYIDGVRVANVDEYAQSMSWQQVLYERAGLADGQHVLEVRFTGQKQSAASSTYVYVDALEVLN